MLASRRVVPTCEFHVPISPTPDFFNRIRFLAASLDRYSGLTPGDYRLVVTVGAAERIDLDRACPWGRQYPIEWRWVPDDVFAAWSMWGTAFVRYTYRFDADVVVMLDGDTLVTGSLAQVIADAAAEDHVAAVPAFYSPFYLHPDLMRVRSPHDWWRELFAATGVGEPAFTMEHTAWPMLRWRFPPYKRELRLSPPYVNAGVVAGGASVMAALGRDVFEDLAIARSQLGTTLDGQVALTLGLHRQRIPFKPLSIACNFPNVPAFARIYRAEASDIRVLHFQSATEVDRQRDFASREAIEALLARGHQGLPLQPLNQVLVTRLADLWQTFVD